MIQSNKIDVLKEFWHNLLFFHFNPQTDVDLSLVKTKYSWGNTFFGKILYFVSSRVYCIFIVFKNRHFQKSCTHCSIMSRKIWWYFLIMEWKKIYGRWICFIKIDSCIIRKNLHFFFTKYESRFKIVENATGSFFLSDSILYKLLVLLHHW